MRSDLKLGLLGRTYKDKIIYVDELNLGETNKIVGVDERLGGAFNILDANLWGVEAKCFCSGRKEALILSETKNSRRTSILSQSCNDGEANGDVYGELMDWLHVVYIDDYYHVDMSRIQSPASIDFCTDQPRGDYRDIIDQCELVFDSRERKGLYSKIRSLTPIILHDEKGCECLWMGQSVFETSIKPVSGLNVNGAGDLFAAIFIRDFIGSSLSSAIESTSVLVTEILKNRSKP